MTESSIGSSNGANAVRGVIVVAVAVAIGLFLMNNALGADSDGGDNNETATAVDSTADGATTTTAATSSTTLPAPTDTRQPAEVPVVVVNGNRVAGVAGRGTARLETFGYNTLEPGNSTDLIETTQILYVEGAEADARAIAEVFEIDPDTFVAPLTAENLPSPDLPDADVLVVIGADNAITFS